MKFFLFRNPKFDNMPKISKAKKTSNKKSTKAARRAVIASKLTTSSDKDVKCAPKDFDETSEWEIEVIILFQFFLVSKLFFLSTIFRSMAASTSAGERKRPASPMDPSAKNTIWNQVRFFLMFQLRISTSFQMPTTVFGSNGRSLSTTKSDGRLRNKVKLHFSNQLKNCHVRPFGWCLQGYHQEDHPGQESVANAFNLGWPQLRSGLTIVKFQIQ